MAERQKKTDIEKTLDDIAENVYYLQRDTGDILGQLDQMKKCLRQIINRLDVIESYTRK